MPIMFMVCEDVHLENAPYPTSVTLSGIVMLLRAVHLQNAFS